MSRINHNIPVDYREENTSRNIRRSKSPQRNKDGAVNVYHLNQDSKLATSSPNKPLVKFGEDGMTSPIMSTSNSVYSNKLALLSHQLENEAFSRSMSTIDPEVSIEEMNKPLDPSVYLSSSKSRVTYSKIGIGEEAMNLADGIHFSDDSPLMISAREITHSLIPKVDSEVQTDVIPVKSNLFFDLWVEKHLDAQAVDSLNVELMCKLQAQLAKVKYTMESENEEFSTAVKSPTARGSEARKRSSMFGKNQHKALVHLPPVDQSIPPLQELSDEEREKLLHEFEYSTTLNRKLKGTATLANVAMEILDAIVDEYHSQLPLLLDVRESLIPVIYMQGLPLKQLKRRVSMMTEEKKPDPPPSDHANNDTKKKPFQPLDYAHHQLFIEKYIDNELLIQQLLIENQTFKTNNKDLQEKYNSKCQEIDDMKHLIENAEAIRDSKNNEILELKNQNQELIKHRDVIQHNLQETKELLQTSQQKIKSLDHAIISKDIEIEHLKEHEIELNEQINDARKQHKKLKEDYDNNVSDHFQLTNEHHTLQKHYELLLSHIQKEHIESVVYYRSSYLSLQTLIKETIDPSLLDLISNVRTPKSSNSIPAEDSVVVNKAMAIKLHSFPTFNMDPNIFNHPGVISASTSNYQLQLDSLLSQSQQEQSYFLDCYDYCLSLEKRKTLHLNKANDYISELQNKLVVMEEEFSKQLQEQKKAYAHELGQLRQEFQIREKAYINDLINFKLECKELKESLNKTEIALEKLNCEHEGLQLYIKDKEEELNTIILSLKENVSMCNEEIYERKVMLLSSRAEAMKQLHQLQDRHFRLTQERNNLEELYNKESEKNKHLENEIKELKDSNTKLEHEMKNQSETYAAKLFQAQELHEKKYAELTTRLNELTTLHNELNKAKDSVEKQLNDILSIEKEEIEVQTEYFTVDFGINTDPVSYETFGWSPPTSPLTKIAKKHKKKHRKRTISFGGEHRGEPNESELDNSVHDQNEANEEEEEVEAEDDDSCVTPTLPIRRSQLTRQSTFFDSNYKPVESSHYNNKDAWKYLSQRLLQEKSKFHQLLKYLQHEKKKIKKEMQKFNQLLDDLKIQIPQQILLHINHISNINLSQLVSQEIMRRMSVIAAPAEVTQPGDLSPTASGSMILNSGVQIVNGELKVSTNNISSLDTKQLLQVGRRLSNLVAMDMSANLLNPNHPSYNPNLVTAIAAAQAQAGEGSLNLSPDLISSLLMNNSEDNLDEIQEKRPKVEIENAMSDKLVKRNQFREKSNQKFFNASTQTNEDDVNKPKSTLLSGAGITTTTSSLSTPSSPMAITQQPSPISFKAALSEQEAKETKASLVDKFRNQTMLAKQIAESKYIDPKQVTPPFVGYLRRHEKIYTRELGLMKVVLREAKGLFDNLLSHTKKLIYSDTINSAEKKMLNAYKAILEDNVWIFDPSFFIKRVHSNPVQDPIDVSAQARTLLSYQETSEEVKKQFHEILQRNHPQSALSIIDPNSTPSYKRMSTDEMILKTIEDLIIDLYRRLEAHGGFETLLFRLDGSVDVDLDVTPFQVTDQVKILSEQVKFLKFKMFHQEHLYQQYIDSLSSQLETSERNIIRLQNLVNSGGGGGGPGTARNSLRRQSHVKSLSQMINLNNTSIDNSAVTKNPLTRTNSTSQTPGSNSDSPYGSPRRTTNLIHLSDLLQHNQNNVGVNTDNCHVFDLDTGANVKVALKEANETMKIVFSHLQDYLNDLQQKQIKEAREKEIDYCLDSATRPLHSPTARPKTASMAMMTARYGPNRPRTGKEESKEFVPISTNSTKRKELSSAKRSNVSMSYDESSFSQNPSQKKRPWTSSTWRQFEQKTQELISNNNPQEYLEKKPAEILRIHGEPPPLVSQTTNSSFNNADSDLEPEPLDLKFAQEEVPNQTMQLLLMCKQIKEQLFISQNYGPQDSITLFTNPPLLELPSEGSVLGIGEAGLETNIPIDNNSLSPSLVGADIGYPFPQPLQPSEQPSSINMNSKMTFSDILDNDIDGDGEGAQLIKDIGNDEAGLDGDPEGDEEPLAQEDNLLPEPTIQKQIYQKLFANVLSSFAINKQQSMNKHSKQNKLNDLTNYAFLVEDKYIRAVDEAKRMKRILMSLQGSHPAIRDTTKDVFDIDTDSQIQLANSYYHFQNRMKSIATSLPLKDSLPPKKRNKEKVSDAALALRQSIQDSNKSSTLVGSLAKVSNPHLTQPVPIRTTPVFDHLIHRPTTSSSYMSSSKDATIIQKASLPNSTTRNINTQLPIAAMLKHQSTGNSNTFNSNSSQVINLADLATNPTPSKLTSKNFFRPTEYQYSRSLSNLSKKEIP